MLLVVMTAVTVNCQSPNDFGSDVGGAKDLPPAMCAHCCEWPALAPPVTPPPSGQGQTWEQFPVVDNAQEEVDSIWDLTGNNSFSSRIASQSFSGKHVLVLGASTSLNVTFTFMAAMLPPVARDAVMKTWKLNGERDFAPLAEHGWSLDYQNASDSTSGCRDCLAKETTVDHVATLYAGTLKEISYEYSWKPEIFSPRDDTVGFKQRYCRKRYDVVFICKGLHDAAYTNVAVNLTSASIRDRFEKLAGLLQCLPSTTLVVLRTPYHVDAAHVEYSEIAKAAAELVGAAVGALIGATVGNVVPTDGAAIVGAIVGAVVGVAGGVKYQNHGRTDQTYSWACGAGVATKSAGVEICRLQNQMTGRISRILTQLFHEGAFDATNDLNSGNKTKRSVLIDGQLLSSSVGHPISSDGHHYPAAMTQSVVNLMLYASYAFFEQGGGLTTGTSTEWKDVIGNKWGKCGLNPGAVPAPVNNTAIGELPCEQQAKVFPTKHGFKSSCLTDTKKGLSGGAIAHIVIVSIVGASICLNFKYFLNLAHVYKASGGPRGAAGAYTKGGRHLRRGVSFMNKKVRVIEV